VEPWGLTPFLASARGVYPRPKPGDLARLWNSDLSRIFSSHLSNSARSFDALLAGNS